MEIFLLLICLFLFLTLVVFPIWAIATIRDLKEKVDSLRHRYEELRALRQRQEDLRETVTGLGGQVSALAATPPPVITPVPVVAVSAPPPPVPEPAPLPIALGGITVEPASTIAAEPSLPPPVPSAPPAMARPAYTPPLAQPGWWKSINWEQFMGAKLFAWLGGFALFLGVAFFVKYSFDHGWIPPEARAAMGFVFSAGLVIGGLRLDRSRYKITSQTLIAAGVVSLYAVTFACRSVYHFAFFGVIPTFLMMSLITAVAFVLADRLKAQVIAVLGLLGGFLTPWLLATGVDNPGGLFGYIALLDLGLIAVALRRRWFHFVPLGAAGTVIMLIGWAGEYYAVEKTPVAMGVCLGFSGLFFAASALGRRLDRSHPLLPQTAIALPAVALCFAWYFLNYTVVVAQPALFFGYVILTSLIVFALAWRENLSALVAVAAGATALLLARWGIAVVVATQAPVIVTVCLVFSGLYFAAYLVARRFDRASTPVLWSTIGLPAVSLVFALFLLQDSALAVRPPALAFGFIFAADLLLLALAWLDERASRLHLASGLAVFALLSVWTAGSLTDGLLPWALAVTLGFAALHSVFPLLLERRRPDAAPGGWSQIFPPLALLLMVLPLFRLEVVPFLLWPAILAIDLLALGLALMTASLAAVGSVLVLTLVATAVCLFKIPATLALPPSLLLVIGFFAVFFFAGSFWLARRLGDRFPKAELRNAALLPVFGDPRAHLPAFASLLPFLLLMMACGRLVIPDPSSIFGLGLLLVVLTLGLAALGSNRGAGSGANRGGIEWLPACALAGMAALEFIWHGRHFNPRDAALPLVWYGAFHAIFAIYPFLFRRRFVSMTGPWCVAALSGLAHFWMTYDAIRAGWPGLKDVLGLVPAAFVLAPLASLVAVLKFTPASEPRRLNQLAWLGGVALCFITLIFPIQFERQWLTVAWALEGAALLWLFHRVPHPGLRATGAVLLTVAFARLALNPAVLGYHVRGGAIFNWYLYAYGLTVAALFTAARLAAPPRERALGINLPPLFNVLATVLAFILLNVEIADFFTVPGTRALTFQFSGNLPRDMSYTIGWSLFALGMLVTGLVTRRKAPRYAAIALLSVALLKLFFHDLASLQALYRIGTLFGVAVIAIVASVAYQHFLPGNEKSSR